MKEALYQLSIDTKPLLIETKQGSFTRLADEIVMVETSGRNVIVHAVDCDYISTQPIKFWYSLTSIGSFFQTHYSFVVNMKYITAFTNNTVVMEVPPNGKLVGYLTRRRYQEFKSAYMIFLEAML